MPQDGAGAARNPMLNAVGAPYAAGWDADDDSIIDDYAGGPRTGEDLILSGVESFDIQVWDDGFADVDLNGNGTIEPFEDRNGNGAPDAFAGQWVNLGHAGLNPSTLAPANLGYFNHSANQNPVYGPLTILPAASVGVGADSQPGIAGNDDNGFGGNDDAGELGWPYSDDPWNRVFDTWHANATTGTGVAPFQPLRVGKSAIQQWTRNTAVTLPATFVLFPGAEDQDNDGNVNGPAEDTNNNGLLDTGEDTNQNGVLDGPEDRNGNGAVDDDLSYYYIPVGVVDPANPVETGDRLPEWPREPGTTVVDGNIIWQCFDNRIGLQMMRIIIRYRDPASGAPRQVTIVHSFVE